MSGAITTASTIIATVAGAAVIIGLIWLAARGDPEREREEAARRFLLEHGHWPDEDPSPAPGGGQPRDGDL